MNQGKFAATVGVAVIMLVIGAAIGSVAFPVTRTETTTALSTITSTISAVSYVTTLAFSSCTTEITINSTQYCALDVTNDISLGAPGYSVFTKADSIQFNGVAFKTLCPSGYSDCPNILGNKTFTALAAGVILVNLGFQDKTKETLFHVLQMGGTENLTLLSKHSIPSAGALIEYVPGYSNAYYKTFLLVESEQNTSSTSSVSTVCQVLGGGELVLKVLNDSNHEPIGGVAVDVKHHDPCNSYIPFDYGISLTNASGIISFFGSGTL